ncbi:MAG TPA: fumarylacetoacetate hydrolase family protein [Chloroflexota bacterium]|jgi:2,4-diketo-3-deoxy-L-fuconate hydrolase|nr:fumarylacetoacetate hydrolase family protein [Chloroflexota bacterium]
MATSFRLATVHHQGQLRPALLTEAVWLDLAAASTERGLAAPAALAAGPNALLALLESWERWLPWLRTLADRAAQGALPDALRLPADPAALRLPFLPRQIFAAGANYYGHAVEMGAPRPNKQEQQPYLFCKPLGSVIGPHEPIVIPPAVTQTDWEAELVAVIGRPAANVSPQEALEYVAAYTILNDVSCRNLGRRTDQPFNVDWILMKGWRTFGPFGPWLVPAEFVPDPQQLQVRLWVNDRLEQDFNTADMIHTTAEQIAWLSRVAPLVPGDVISTGTGAGVGRPKGRFLQPGDRVTIEIERIGRLENPVTAG